MVPVSKVSWKDNDTFPQPSAVDVERMTAKNKRRRSTTTKMSMSKLQRDHQLQQNTTFTSENSLIITPRLKNHTREQQRNGPPILKEPTFLTQMPDEQDFVDTPCFYLSGDAGTTEDNVVPHQNVLPSSRNSRSSSVPSLRPASPSPVSKKRISDPRQYAAIYYASKLSPQHHHEQLKPTPHSTPKDGVDTIKNDRQKKVESASRGRKCRIGDNNVRSRSNRGFHQKMTDCLLLASDLYLLEQPVAIDDSEQPKRKNGRSSNEKNNLFCFGTPSSAMDTSYDTTVTDEITDNADGTVSVDADDDDDSLEQRQSISESSSRDRQKSSDHRTKALLVEQRGRARQRDMDNDSTYSETTCPTIDDDIFGINGNEDTRILEWRRIRQSAMSRFNNCSTIESERENDRESSAAQKTTSAPPLLPRVLSWTRSVESTATSSPTSVLQVNPDDFDCSRSYRKNLESASPPLDRHLDMGNSTAFVQVATYSSLPPLPPGRDHPRRPQGMYDSAAYTTSNTKDTPASNSRNPNDDDATRTSIPYDESANSRRLSSEAHQERANLEILSTKYAIAQHDKVEQDKFIYHLQKQMKESTVLMNAMKRDLQQANDDSTKRSQVFEEATRKIFRERIETDEQLRKELQANQCFQREILQLKDEITRLAMEREQEKAQNSTVRSNDTLTREQHETSNISLLDRQTTDEVSEVTILREQLHQEQTTNHAALTELYQFKLEREEAKIRILQLEDELNSVTTLAQEMKLQGVDLPQSQGVVPDRAQMEDEIAQLKLDVAACIEATKQYASENKNLQDEKISLQMETNRFSMETSRLEKELQLAKAITVEQVCINDAETKRLKVDVKEAMDKLSQANSEIIRQAADHMKERKRSENNFQAVRMLDINVNADASVGADHSNFESTATGMLHGLPSKYSERNMENRSYSILMDILRKKLSS